MACYCHNSYLLQHISVHAHDEAGEQTESMAPLLLVIHFLLYSKDVRTKNMHVPSTCNTHTLQTSKTDACGNRNLNKAPNTSSQKKNGVPKNDNVHLGAVASCSALASLPRRPDRFRIQTTTC